MRRKLIKQGVGGATIFLPIGWVRKNNLKPGEEVDVEEKEGNLVISGGRGEPQKALEMDVTDLDVRSINEIIIAAYTSGYSELIIRFKNKTAEDIKAGLQDYIETKDLPPKTKVTRPVIDIIYDTVRDLLGYEVVEQKEHHVRVKQISKIDEQEFNVTMRRIHLLTQELNSTLISQMKVGRYNSQEMLKMIFNIRRFVNYGMRILSSKVVQRNNLDLYAILSRFRRFTHLYIYTTEWITKLRFSRIEETINILENFGKLLKTVENTQYDFSYDKYNQFEKLLRATYSIQNITYKNACKDEIMLRQMLMECCLDTRFMMNNVLAMNLEN